MKKVAASRIMIEMKAGVWQHSEKQSLVPVEGDFVFVDEQQNSIRRMNFNNFAELDAWVRKVRPELTNFHVYRNRDEPNLFASVYETEIARTVNVHRRDVIWLASSINEYAKAHEQVLGEQS